MTEAPSQKENKTKANKQYEPATKRVDYTVADRLKMVSWS